MASTTITSRTMRWPRHTVTQYPIDSVSLIILIVKRQALRSFLTVHLYDKIRELLAASNEINDVPFLMTTHTHRSKAFPYLFPLLLYLPFFINIRRLVFTLHRNEFQARIFYHNCTKCKRATHRSSTQQRWEGRGKFICQGLLRPASHRPC